jgi:predicted metal-dependent phosphoesterase TrpH
MTVSEVMQEAHRRGIGLISITDHDSVDCQESAEAIGWSRYGIHYISGVELNISFSHPAYRQGKPVSLDVLGYQYDYRDRALTKKLSDLRAFRRQRAEKILENINRELKAEAGTSFTQGDLEAIEETVDGAFGRPHIANYMVKKGIVRSRQEAFDKYLVHCDVPKMPVSLEEAAKLVRGAGGKLILAHPSDVNGTSLFSLTNSLTEQHSIIRESMLPHLDGLECWHSRHDKATAAAHLAFAKEQKLLVTGGSDCHQQPVTMGAVHVPAFVAEQFGLRLE